MAQSKQSITPYELDSVDSSILNTLLEDSRRSFRDISKLIHKSPVTVMNRLKRIQQMGIIKRYTCELDYEQLGFDVSAIIELQISKGKLFSVEKKIASHPNVIATYDNTGDFDATIICRFRNRRGLDNFLKKIQTYDFVMRTRTKLILNTIKEQGNNI